MRPSVRTWWSPYGASAWCLTFAALHIYWAVGGELGLASSAGSDLAARRPALFVLVGLWGTAMLLLLGARLSAALARGRPPTRLRRLATATGWLVGAALLARGVVLELVLAMGAGGISASVGASEAYWGLESCGIPGSSSEGSPSSLRLVASGSHAARARRRSAEQSAIGTPTGVGHRLSRRAAARSGAAFRLGRTRPPGKGRWRSSSGRRP